MKRLLLLVALILGGSATFAQSPHAFSYQAVVRDGTGAVLANKSVSFRISILEGSVTGTIVFTEKHRTVSNSFGLVTLEIGKGEFVAGSIGAINWGANRHFINVELDPNGGSAYLFMGAHELLSVPYALNAKTVELDQVNDADADPNNELQELQLSGTQLTLTKGGGTVTLPSTGGGDNWGTQTVVTNATLAGNGTGAVPLRLADNGVTSSTIQDGTVSQTDLGDNSIVSSKIIDGSVATADLANSSVTTEKIYSGAVTGVKIAQEGATSGQVLKWNGTTWAPGSDESGGSSQWQQSGPDIYFNAGKVGIGAIPGSSLRNFQSVTTDMQAVAGTNNSATYAAIFGENLGTGPAADFRDNIRIADGTQGAGKVLTSDLNGYTSWQDKTIVTNPSYFTGNGTAASPLSLSSMGASTGQVLKWSGTAWDNAADDNGPWSETTNYIYNSGSKNFGIGINVPSQKLTIAEGGSSCYMNFQNSSTGFTANDGLILGLSGVDGILTNVENGKLFLGANNGVKMTIEPGGDVGIGTAIPSYKLDVAGSVNINKGVASGIALNCNGDEAIWYNGTYFSWGYGGSYNFFGDKIFIGPTAADPGSNQLVVNGSAAKPGGGSWSTWSDARLKEIHGNYSKGLDEIIQLQPVTYSYKEGNEANLPDDKDYVGLVAQEVQVVFPEAISDGGDGFLQFDINPVNIALINAIKGLKAENDQLKAENEQMKLEHEKVLLRLEKLEKYISAEAKIN